MSGEPTVESTAGDRRDQDEPGGRLERVGRDRPELHRLGAAEAVGGEALELLLLSHGGDIGLTAADL